MSLINFKTISSKLGLSSYLHKTPFFIQELKVTDCLICQLIVSTESSPKSQICQENMIQGRGIQAKNSQLFYRGSKNYKISA